MKLNAFFFIILCTLFFCSGSSPSGRLPLSGWLLVVSARSCQYFENLPPAFSHFSWGHGTLPEPLPAALWPSLLQPGHVPPVCPAHPAETGEGVGTQNLGAASTTLPALGVWLAFHLSRPCFWFVFPTLCGAAWLRRLLVLLCTLRVFQPALRPTTLSLPGTRLLRSPPSPLGSSAQRPAPPRGKLPQQASSCRWDFQSASLPIDNICLFFITR